MSFSDFYGADVDVVMRDDEKYNFICCWRLIEILLCFLQHVSFLEIALRVFAKMSASSKSIFVFKSPLLNELLIVKFRIKNRKEYDDFNIEVSDTSKIG